MKPFTSKLNAFQSAVPVYACSRCRERHDATKHAICTGCKHITAALPSTPGRKTTKNCPNCARPLLKNRYKPPFACTRCGHTEFDFFHSTGEFTLFAKLALMQDSGKIMNLRRQVPFPIKFKGDPEPITTYVADYVFDEPHPDGKTHRRIIDHKGHEKGIDPVFKLKKKLVERFYPGVIIEVITAS